MVKICYYWFVGESRWVHLLPNDVCLVQFIISLFKLELFGLAVYTCSKNEILTQILKAVKSLKLSANLSKVVGKERVLLSPTSLWYWRKAYAIADISQIDCMLLNC